VRFVLGSASPCLVAILSAAGGSIVVDLAMQIEGPGSDLRVPRRPVIAANMARSVFPLWSGQSSGLGDAPSPATSELKHRFVPVPIYDGQNVKRGPTQASIPCLGV